MKHTEPTSSEVQLIMKVHNLYKAETDKRIEDLQQLIDIRDQEIDIRDKRIESLKQEIEDLRQTVREKDERIDELTDFLIGKDKTKCKVVSLRPAYSR